MDDMVKLESDEVTDDKVPVKAAVAPPAKRFVLRLHLSQR